MNAPDPSRDPHDHDHHAGLPGDLAAFARLAGRRHVLGWLVGAGVVSVLGCNAASSNDGAGGGAGEGGDDAGTGGSGTGECSAIPEETAGPYPGDGTNDGGTNALTLSGIVRSDIRSSLGDASGTAEGVPLTVVLTLVDASNRCEAISGHAIYLWHCDRDGNYSMYTVADQNYLRGVQETNGSGEVTFETIFPAAYSGRWPHIHFEIYPSLELAVDGNDKVATSQLALPEDACNDVFDTAGYEQSITNMAQTSLESDMVFADGATLQVPTVSGNVTDGFTVRLTVAIGG